MQLLIADDFCWHAIHQVEALAGKCQDRGGYEPAGYFALDTGIQDKLAMSNVQSFRSGSVWISLSWHSPYASKPSESSLNGLNCIVLHLYIYRAGSWHRRHRQRLGRQILGGANFREKKYFPGQQ